MKKTQIIPSRLNSCKIYSIAQNKLKKIYNTNSEKEKERRYNIHLLNKSFTK